MLPDFLIEAEMGRGLEVTPFDPAMLQPASLDVRLGRELLLNAGGGETDPKRDTVPHWIGFNMQDEEGICIHRDEFMLGATYEKVRLGPGIAARFEGKSSLGRLGLLTHVTAGFIDPGFEGHITVELKNVSSTSIRLYPGMKIGQLCFTRLEAPAHTPYGSASTGSHYQGQTGPQPSRIHENFHQTKLP